MSNTNFLKKIVIPSKIITPIDSTIRFPEIIESLLDKYNPAINVFSQLISECQSSQELLVKIRQSDRNSEERMALLKMFRRCVSPVLDTETTKKIKKISSEDLIETYGKTFKSIQKLKEQFTNLPKELRFALAALIGEYDMRGQVGYQLTALFFDWFEEKFSGKLTIEGPRGAGRDIELNSIFGDFVGTYPCDFVVKNLKDEVLAIGFARYDSTRGGAQSDDRTGGNANKVGKAIEYSKKSGNKFKIIFLADGPGLLHNDTWNEACELDGQWDGRVRVTTLKLLEERISHEWLES